MEIFVSAVLGELVSRSINFIISKRSKPTIQDVEDSLQRALLRAQVIVDEAMGRHITNQAMLQQLCMLRDAMHRGCYMLDTFRYQCHDEEEAESQIVSHSFSLSGLNSLKEICSSNIKKVPLEQLQESLDNLSSVILDVKEMVAFLMSYPPMYRQPYSMHLLLSNCMFGFQMETELAVNFLLHSRPHGSEELEVLPIVGPSKVGKSTLVAHVCGKERVRDHFSEILFLRGHDFTDDDLSTFRQQACAMKHQSRTSNTNKDGRWLLVVDFVGDLDGDAWNTLYSSCKQCMPRNSKIIVTGRSDKIVKFGTKPPLRLKHPSPEAFWYFFKTLTFESMDPKMHTRFARLAMEIVKWLSGDLIGANLTACLLRDNFNIHFWCRVLAFLRDFVQSHVSRFGVHPADPMNQNKLVHVGKMAEPFEDFMFYHEHKSSLREELPKIRIEDLMYGSVKAPGKLEVLGWTSRIPPYDSYAVTCEIRELKTRAAKRKRSIRK